MYLKYFNIRVILLLLPLMLAIHGCNDDEAEPEPQRTITTRWSAAGDQVAPLFRAFPLNIDSIYLRLVQHEPRMYEDTLYWYIYMEKFIANASTPKEIIDGQDDYGAKFIRTFTGTDSIFHFETQDALRNGNQVTARGLYQVQDEEDSATLKLEYVYMLTGWPPPPLANEGFGSTSGGAYGENNIHHFKRIEEEDDDDDDEE